jgi:hypothetical protein
LTRSRTTLTGSFAGWQLTPTRCVSMRKPVFLGCVPKKAQAGLLSAGFVPASVGFTPVGQKATLSWKKGPNLGHLLSSFDWHNHAVWPIVGLLKGKTLVLGKTSGGPCRTARVRIRIIEKASVHWLTVGRLSRAGP